MFDEALGDEPKVVELQAWEYARLFMAHPFNRFAWEVEPPQSISDYNSPRMKQIGLFYSRLVRLFMLDFPNDADAETGVDWAQLSEVIELLGPAFVDKHFTTIYTDGLVTDCVLNTDPDEFDQDLEWEDVFALYPEIKKSADKYLGKFRQPPIGEPERDLASYKRRETRLRTAMGLEKEKRKREKKPMSSRKKAKTQHKSDEMVNPEDDATDTETTEESSSSSESD